MMRERYVSLAAHILFVCVGRVIFEAGPRVTALNAARGVLLPCCPSLCVLYSFTVYLVHAYPVA